MIRKCRTAGALTQATLGRRAGIVGKYVSEIERGTRDVPLSTLRAVVEDGLGLRLLIEFQKGPVPLASTRTLPPTVEEVASAIADLPTEQRASVLTILRTVIKLAQR